MKAIVNDSFGGPEVMRVASIPEPTPAPGQVLVRVAATSVNRPDVVQRQGNYPPPPGDSNILGLEIAGTVAALGDGVDQWRCGDRVMGLVGGGAYAEYSIAWADHLMRIPESMSWEQAACVSETYITAHLNLFQFPGLVGGQKVLLHGGGGGVNTAAIQLCRVLAPSVTILVTASTTKVQRVRDLGVDHVIDYQQQDFQEEVAKLTNGRGVDVILDHIGAAYLHANLKSLAVNGTLMLIGVMGGAKNDLNLAQLMVKRQKIAGSVLRPRPVDEKAAIISRFASETLELFSDAKIVPLVHKIFPLDEVVEAHKLMEESGHFGKLVLAIDSGILV
jgi:putative PIG3 family NAD(P)H quinone oxidoreductase